MDGDSTAEIGSSLMFDFDFDDDVPLIDSLHSQAHPTHQNPTAMNSYEKLGSSSGRSPPVLIRTQKQNLATAAHTITNENLDSSVENAPNFTPPRASSLNPDPLKGTPQVSHPTTESSELQPPAKDQKKQLPASDQVNSDTNLSGNEHISQDSTTSSPLVSAPNLSPTVTSSFITPLISGAPPQLPYVSTMHEQLGNLNNSFQPSNSLNVELGSSIGSNQSLLNYVHSSQSLMGSTYSGFGGTDPSHGNGTNMHQAKSTFFNSPFSATKSQQYPPVLTGEMIPQMSVVPSFISEHEMVLKHPKQLNTRPENGPQNELLHQQGMSALNLSSPQCADQLAQNQRPLPYPTSFPQSSTGLGNVNQQLPTWLSNQNAPFMPLTPPRSQINQCQATNVFDPQYCTNSMLPTSSLPIRPQLHSANQLQLFNQAPENVFNPQSQSSMIPEYSTLLRPQHLPYQSNQVPAVPNLQDPQRCNTMMPVPSMALSLRPPEYLQHQQLNQAAFPPEASNLQRFNSLQPNPSMLAKIPELNDRNQSMLPEPLMLPLSQTFEIPGVLNQPARPSVAYPGPGSSQLNQVFNPSTQREIDGYNPAGVTFPQLELSLGNRNEQTSLGRRRRGRASSRYESGESSSSNKRSRVSNLSYESGSTSQSLENQINNPFLSNPFSISRPLKNTVYDPIFEGIGLPVDPHLRLFNAN